jgi:hypothetical protein
MTSLRTLFSRVALTTAGERDRIPSGRRLSALSRMTLAGIAGLVAGAITMAAVKADAEGQRRALGRNTIATTQALLDAAGQRRETRAGTVNAAQIGEMEARARTLAGRAEQLRSGPSYSAGEFAALALGELTGQHAAIGEATAAKQRANAGELENTTRALDELTRALAEAKRQLSTQGPAPVAPDSKEK